MDYIHFWEEHHVNTDGARKLGLTTAQVEPHFATWHG